MPKANNARALWPILVIVVAALAVGGCSSGGDTTSGLSLSGDKGTHPVDFLATHPGFAVASVSQCTPCHGDDLKGGIANTSCFTAACHHGTKTGWVVFPPGPPQGHGTSAKKKPGSSGFVSCQICHGKDFLGGSVKVACLSPGCHGGTGQSPHPAQWRTGSDYVHSTTDEGNASVCALCHLAGANSPIGPPSPPAAAGTPPGCFNSTLCHGAGGAPHPVGSAWVATPPAAQPHGNSAKAMPSSSEGFAYCRGCHGTSTGNYNGGTAQVSCLNVACHGANAPHPGQWRTGDIYVHTVADPGNASVCAFCHLAGTSSPIAPPPAPTAGTPPGCYNSTLCHSEVAAPHGLGSTWTAPNLVFHGPTAKQDLSFCQACHGTPGTILFEGGTAPTKCSTCHAAAKAHPTTWSQAPQVGFPPYTPSHRNAGSISTSCAICHDVDGPGPGIGPNSAAPSCFSVSFTNANGVIASCHADGPGSPNHWVPFLDPDHLGVNQADFDVDCSNCHAVSGSSPVSRAPSCQVCHTAGSPLSPTGSFGVCTSCHGYPPDGVPGTYPNVAGNHIVHLALDSLGAGTPIDCDTCHYRLGFVTQAHYDRANGRPGAGGRVPPGDLAFDNVYKANTGASSFDSDALSCLNVSCHGGQTTPNWRTGAIDVSTQCTSCHAYGTGQFNSFNSGRHDKHVNDKKISCTQCHNTATLAVNHFKALGTQAMEGPASATIGGGSTSIPAGNYNTTTKSCNPSCHGTESWSGD